MNASALGAPATTRAIQRENGNATRRRLLDATAAAIASRGTAATIEQVAQAAGVSKGGLLYHFSSREQMFIATVQDANIQFRDAVHSRVNRGDVRPGALLRAYIETVCSGEQHPEMYFAASPLWNGLYSIPEIAEGMRAEAAYWTRELAHDGIAPERVTTIRRSAEGIATAVCFGEEPREALDLAKRTLLALLDTGAFPDNTSAA